jgi:hypothetical protein
MPATRAASSTLNEIIVELYRMREWLDWMKPMPPMSAARLKHQSMPSQAFLQFSGQRRSRFMNSSQNVSSDMYSFSFQSIPRTYMPSSFRRLARWDAMKPPAPVTQIFVPLGKSLVKHILSTVGSTILLPSDEPEWPSAGTRAVAGRTLQTQQRRAEQPRCAVPPARQAAASQATSAAADAGSRARKRKRRWTLDISPSVPALGKTKDKAP